MTRTMIAASLVVMALPMRGMAQDSQCRGLKRNNFRLNSALLYLDQAEHTTYADQKAGRLNNAARQLNDAARAGDADQFSVWYTYGRVYALQGDLVGADSAMTKASTLAASDTTCVREIVRQRRNLWIPIQNEAVGQLQAQNYDSALALLRKGNLIYRDDPGSYLNMASAYMAKQMDDSATAMFRLAAHAGNAPDRADLRATAAFNAARMSQRNNHLAQAESLYREYLVMKPRDVEAKGSLASLLTQMGRGTEATAIYDTLLANADSLDSFGLFSVGVALFRAGQADSAPANAARRHTTLESAARAFELGLRKNPNFRDALFNLTNTYLAAGDSAKVLDAARRLVAIDSFSTNVWTLLARAQQLNRRPSTEVLATLQKRDSLPLEVTVMRFEPGDSTASIRGGVQNLQSRERAGFNLVLEFLDGQGQVVATERVDVPTLNSRSNPGSVYDFNIQTRGRGIVAYRYRIG